MLTRHRNAPLLLLLAIMLAGALFPFGWLGERWPAFGDWIDTAFPTEAAHWVGHVAIFAALGAGALRIWPALLGRPGAYAALALAVGVGQELFQRSYRGFRITGNDLLDLCFDMAGAAAVFVAARLHARRGGGAER